MEDQSENEIGVLKKCLESQIAEFELLSSIFCNENELRCVDPSTLPRIKAFLDDETDELPNFLEFSVFLVVPNADDKVSFGF